jgi:hypothetical protein
MWTALFTIAIVAAIGFVLVAAWMSPQIPNAVPDRKNRWSLMAEFAAGCRDFSRAACAAFEPTWSASGASSGPARKVGEAHLPSLAKIAVRDPTLLPRRMRLLRIDPDELARAEPLLFRQQAVRCGQCDSTEQCARDLVEASNDPFGEDWRDYCPNASTLSTISTLRGIGSPLTALRDSAGSSMGDMARTRY